MRVAAGTQSQSAILDMPGKVRRAQLGKIASFISDTYRIIRKHIAGFDNESNQMELMEALTEYKIGCKKIYEDILESSELTLKLAENIVRTIELFGSYIDLHQNNEEFQQRICELLAIFISCELRVSIDAEEDKLLIANRIIYIMRKYLFDKEYYDEEQRRHNIIRTLVYIPRLFNAREIMCAIFEEFVKTKEIQEKAHIVSDKLYILYIITFYRWMKMHNDAKDEKLLIDFAEKFMKPKATLFNNKLYAMHLPRCATLSSATRTILNNMKFYRDIRNASIMDNSFKKLGYFVNLCDDEDHHFGADNNFNKEINFAKIYAAANFEEPINNASKESHEITMDPLHKNHIKWLCKLHKSLKNSTRKTNCKQSYIQNDIRQKNIIISLDSDDSETEQEETDVIELLSDSSLSDEDAADENEYIKRMAKLPTCVLSVPQKVSESGNLQQKKLNYKQHQHHQHSSITVKQIPKSKTNLDYKSNIKLQKNFHVKSKIVNVSHSKINFVPSSAKNCAFSKTQRKLFKKTAAFDDAAKSTKIRLQKSPGIHSKAPFIYERDSTKSLHYKVVPKKKKSIKLNAFDHNLRSNKLNSKISKELQTASTKKNPNDKFIQTSKNNELELMSSRSNMTNKKNLNKTKNCNVKIKKIACLPAVADIRSCANEESIKEAVIHHKLKANKLEENLINKTQCHIAHKEYDSSINSVKINNNNFPQDHQKSTIHIINNNVNNNSENARVSSITERHNFIQSTIIEPVNISKSNSFIFPNNKMEADNHNVDPDLRDIALSLTELSQYPAVRFASCNEMQQQLNSNTMPDNINETIVIPEVASMNHNNLHYSCNQELESQQLKKMLDDINETRVATSTTSMNLKNLRHSSNRKLESQYIQKASLDYKSQKQSITVTDDINETNVVPDATSMNQNNLLHSFSHKFEPQYLKKAPWNDNRKKSYEQTITMPDDLNESNVAISINQKNLRHSSNHEVESQHLKKSQSYVTSAILSLQSQQQTNSNSKDNKPGQLTQDTIELVVDSVYENFPNSNFKQKTETTNQLKQKTLHTEDPQSGSVTYPKIPILAITIQRLDDKRKCYKISNRTISKALANDNNQKLNKTYSTSSSQKLFNNKATTGKLAQPACSMENFQQNHKYNSEKLDIRQLSNETNKAFKTLSSKTLFNNKATPENLAQPACCTENSYPNLKYFNNSEKLEITQPSNETNSKFNNSSSKILEHLAQPACSMENFQKLNNTLTSPSSKTYNTNNVTFNENLAQPTFFNQKNCNNHSEKSETRKYSLDSNTITCCSLPLKKRRTHSDNLPTAALLGNADDDDNKPSTSATALLMNARYRKIAETSASPRRPPPINIVAPQFKTGNSQLSTICKNQNTNSFSSPARFGSFTSQHELPESYSATHSSPARFGNLTSQLELAEPYSATRNSPARFNSSTSQRELPESYPATRMLSVANVEQLIEFHRFIEEILLNANVINTLNNANACGYNADQHNELETIAILEHYNKLMNNIGNKPALCWKKMNHGNIAIFHEIDNKWLALPAATLKQLNKLSFVISILQQQYNLVNKRQRINLALTYLMEVCNKTKPSSAMQCQHSSNCLRNNAGYSGDFNSMQSKIDEPNLNSSNFQKESETYQQQDFAINELLVQQQQIGCQDVESEQNYIDSPAIASPQNEIILNANGDPIPENLDEDIHISITDEHNSDGFGAKREKPCQHHTTKHCMPDDEQPVCNLKTMPLQEKLQITSHKASPKQQNPQTVLHHLDIQHYAENSQSSSTNSNYLLRPHITNLIRDHEETSKSPFRAFKEVTKQNQNTCRAFISYHTMPNLTPKHMPSSLDNFEDSSEATNYKSIPLPSPPPLIHYSLKTNTSCSSSSMDQLERSDALQLVQSFLEQSEVQRNSSYSPESASQEANANHSFS